MREQTLILGSGKCSWGKCFACGWGRLETKTTPEKLKQLVEQKDIKDVDILKVFASGSFFDDSQFSRDFRKWFAEYIKKNNIKQLYIESRPEFVTKQNLADFKGIDLTVAIGLESSNDDVLKKYGKGFVVKDYLKAVEILKTANCKLRTYIMVNIPFGARKDFDNSVKFALEYSDSIVLINTFPHAKAPLFDLWVEGKWKPLNTKEFEEWTKKYKSKPKIELDAQNYAFVPKFPPEKRFFIKGANTESLNNNAFVVWQDYFQRFYERPKDKSAALFIPCSYQKPYSYSHTFKSIHETLRKTGKLDKLHLIVLSTPGVVPIEFCDYYPFNAYDWPEWEETPELMKEYIRVIQFRIKKYLEAQKYEKVFCFFKPSAETFQALQNACDELEIKLVNLLDKEAYEEVKDMKNPVTQKQALESLKKNVIAEMK